MTQAIPMSRFVNDIPGVLQAGANGLSLSGLFLSEDASIAQGTVPSFANAAAVGAWFGLSSPEYALAQPYFLGFTGRTQIPNAILFAPYNQAAVAAYVRGATVAGMALGTLTGLAGTLIATINGEVVTSANINLSAATSFSNAAAIMTTGLQTPGGIFSGTASFATTVMTVTVVTSGAVHVGDTIVATGVPGGTTVISFGTGTGGVGTYNLSAAASTESAEAVTISSTAVASYDAQRAAFLITSPTTGATSTIGYVSGTLAAGLNLTAALGATLSQGAAAATPAGVMNMVIGVTQNWATFTTVEEPVLANKEAFAVWSNAQEDEYLYVPFDSDPTAIASAPAAGCFGAIAAAAGYSGVAPIWNPSGLVAAFVMGTIASINFNAAGGRIALAFRSQTGLVPDVVTETVYNNLVANGYNCYANVATNAATFQWFQPGSMPGPWDFIDSFVNQIWLNAQLQLDGAEFMSSVNSFPYDPIGYAQYEQALLPTVTQFGKFGGFATGVVLSGVQIDEVNTAAGTDIAGTLFTDGFYIQVLDPGPQVRAVRGPPITNLWYTDGDSVGSLTLNAIDVL